MRTFWLSFTDPDRPKGDQFLGVAIVDVTEEDAARAATLVAARMGLAEEPDSGAAWIAAAVQRAWLTKCNPGGQVMTIDVTGEHEAEKAPHHSLLSRADLRDLGLGDDASGGES